MLSILPEWLKPDNPIFSTLKKIPHMLISLEHPFPFPSRPFMHGGMSFDRGFAAPKKRPPAEAGGGGREKGSLSDRSDGTARVSTSVAVDVWSLFEPGKVLCEEALRHTTPRTCPPVGHMQVAL